MAVSTKTDRIDFRISEADKLKLEKAAQLNHLSLTAYIASTVLKQADIDLQKYGTIILDEPDSNLIIESLDSNIEPNYHLTNLFK